MTWYNSLACILIIIIILPTIYTPESGAAGKVRCSSLSSQVKCHLPRPFGETSLSQNDFKYLRVILALSWDQQSIGFVVYFRGDCRNIRDVWRHNCRPPPRSKPRSFRKCCRGAGLRFFISKSDLAVHPLPHFSYNGYFTTQLEINNPVSNTKRALYTPIQFDGSITQS